MGFLDFLNRNLVTINQKEENRFNTRHLIGFRYWNQVKINCNVVTMY